MIRVRAKKVSIRICICFVVQQRALFFDNVYIILFLEVLLRPNHTATYVNKLCQCVCKDAIHVLNSQADSP